MGERNLTPKTICFSPLLRMFPPWKLSMYPLQALKPNKILLILSHSKSGILTPSCKVRWMKSFKSSMQGTNTCKSEIIYLKLRSLNSEWQQMRFKTNDSKNDKFMSLEFKCFSKISKILKLKSKNKARFFHVPKMTISFKSSEKLKKNLEPKLISSAKRCLHMSSNFDKKTKSFIQWRKRTKI